MIPTPSPSQTESVVLLSPKEVVRRTSLSRATLYRLMKDGKFPRSVPLGDSRIGFVEAEVQAWIGAKLALREVS